MASYSRPFVGLKLNAASALPTTVLQSQYAVTAQLRLDTKVYFREAQSPSTEKKTVTGACRW